MNPVIPNEFLAKPAPELPVEFIEQHSLKRWIVDFLFHSFQLKRQDVQFIVA